jgi:tetratricopeptide (TPR) repeat protein
MKWSIVVLVSLAFSLGAAAQKRPSGAAVKEFVDVLRSARQASDAGRWTEAAKNWERVVALNPVNEEYWEKLGEAYYKHHDFRQAIPAFEKVLDLGGHCFPSETSYNIARSFALLGDTEEAVSWLQHAFATGYRDLDHAKTDPAYKALHDDRRFVALVGDGSGADVSRDEGWKRDLDLLQRELQRKSYPQFVKMSNEELQADIARLTLDIPKLSDTQATIEVMKLVTKMGVGHTEAWPQYTQDFAKTLPLKFFLFKEGLYVIAADPKYQYLLGAQILSFGDASTSQAIASVAPLVFRDNDIWVKTFGPYLLRYTAVLKGLNLISDLSQASLTIRDLQGQTRIVNVSADTSYPNIWNVYPYPETWSGFVPQGKRPVPLYLRNMQTLYWFTYLPESRTVYFQFNRVLPDSKEPFDKFVARLFAFINQHDVNKLVIDLRWNNGGNTYLVPPLIHAVIRTSKINREGRLFVIIGRRTFSAAENTAAYIQRETNAIFVGEPTGGKPSSLGDETYFNLPYSKLTASVADVYWESSWPQDFRTWVAPQLFVEPTFEALNSSQDAALDAVLGFVSPGFAISQHPGFWCKSEQVLDIDSDRNEPAPPATSLGHKTPTLAESDRRFSNDKQANLANRR